jgi:hypothetical protein
MQRAAFEVQAARQRLTLPEERLSFRKAVGPPAKGSCELLNTLCEFINRSI